jgi:hypothetical protein
MQALVAAPAATALVAQQTTPPATPATTPAAALAPSGGRGGRGGGRGGFGGGQAPTLLETTSDGPAETVVRFFTPAQMNALAKLCETFMPALNGSPGAIDCGAPEFLDFLIGVSPADRKQLYRGGLDALNAHSTAKYNKPFANLDANEIDAIIRPLLAASPWALDAPKDPVVHFIAAARTDITQATRNSPEWAAAVVGGAGRGGRGGGFGAGGQLMWLPIDPIYKG